MDKREVSAKEVKELDEIFHYEQCLKFRVFIEENYTVVSVYDRGEYPNERTTVKLAQNITVSYNGNWYTQDEKLQMEMEHLQENEGGETK